MTTSQEYAKALIKIGAVGFKPDEPITFKSGMLSPVYVDNRRFPFYPSEWKLVVQGLADLIHDQKLPVDVIAGIETAGIPHSAALGFLTEIPSVFVRKAAKDHGTKKRVEGGDVSGKKVVLVEDHVTTGGSSLSGVEALRAEGAKVTHCLAITSYDFPESQKAFAEAGVTLIPLVLFPDILSEAQTQGKLTADQVAEAKKWLADPWNWRK
jgi:orotate phosphoribosyltransferase